MCCGFFTESLEQILFETGWPKPKNCQILLEQAVKVATVFIQINRPSPVFTDMMIKGPARYIEHILFGEDNKATNFAVTHGIESNLNRTFSFKKFVYI